MEISFSFQWLKNFENPLRFDEITAMSLVVPFYVDTVYICLSPDRCARARVCVWQYLRTSSSVSKEKASCPVSTVVSLPSLTRCPSLMFCRRLQIVYHDHVNQTSTCIASWVCVLLRLIHHHHHEPRTQHPLESCADLVLSRAESIAQFCSHITRPVNSASGNAHPSTRG